MKSDHQKNVNPEERDNEIIDGQKDTPNGDVGDKMADESGEIEPTGEVTEEPAGDTENSRKELEELKGKYNELNDSFLRLNAEFDNFRKRTLKEKADLIKSGGERVLLDIITLVDDFERALDALHKTEGREALLEGMDLIYAKFTAFLRQHGVTEIEAVGQPFDSDGFEAVTTIPAPEASQKGIVLDCIQKGYRLNDKIIRFPKVIVGE